MLCAIDVFVVWIRIIDVSCVCFLLLCWLQIDIVTGCEFHVTTFCSAGKFPRMNQSLKSVPMRMFTAKCGAVPNHKRVCMPSMQRWRRIYLSNFMRFLDAVCRFGTFFSIHSFSNSDESTKTLCNSQQPLCARGKWFWVWNWFLDRIKYENWTLAW